MSTERSVVAFHLECPDCGYLGHVSLADAKCPCCDGPGKARCDCGLDVVLTPVYGSLDHAAQ